MQLGCSNFLREILQSLSYLMTSRKFQCISYKFNVIRSVFSAFAFRLITRVGTLIVATIYLQLIQNRYMFRSFTVLHCSHQQCVQPVASDVEVVGYL